MDGWAEAAAPASLNPDTRGPKATTTPPSWCEDGRGPAADSGADLVSAETTQPRTNGTNDTQGREEPKACSVPGPSQLRPGRALAAGARLPRTLPAG